MYFCAEHEDKLGPSADGKKRTKTKGPEENTTRLGFRVKSRVLLKGLSGCVYGFLQGLLVVVCVCVRVCAADGVLGGRCKG